MTIFASAPDVILCSRQGDLIFPLCQAVLYNSCDSFKNLYNLRFGFRVVASSVHESVSAVEPLSFSEDVVEAQALDAPRSHDMVNIKCLFCLNYLKRKHKNQMF